MVVLNEQQQVSENPATIEVTKKVEAGEVVSISEDDYEKAQRNFQQGKKFLILNKFDEAVSNFDEACQVYTKKFGELNVECADLYFYYGKSLLELARVENTVLGNALNGIPEEDSAPIDDSRYGNPDEVEEKERESIAEKVIDAMCVSDEQDENGAAVSAPVEPVVESAVEEKPVVEAVEPKPVEAVAFPVEEKPVVEGENVVVAEPVVSVVVDEVKPVVESGDAVEAVENGEEDGDEVEGEEGDEEEVAGEEAADGEDDDEDITNLQRAWEMFELAKLVYKSNLDKEKVLFTRRIAECLLKLGEISIEREIYEQALVDIAESVKVQEDELRENRDERLLAETYYQLGLAQQFSNQFQSANESYQRSQNILQLRVDKLKGELSVGESTLSDDKKKELNDEISELEAILPEITSKLDECNSDQQDQQNLVKEAKEVFANKLGGSNGVQVAENSDVKDITSLVKSKRKLENDSVGDVKKVRLEGENCEQQQNEVAGEAPVVQEQSSVDVELTEQNE